MINLFCNLRNWLRTSLFYSALETKRGAATLVFTVILMVMSTLIIIFAANFGRIQERIAANLNRNMQAFEAAEAGLEFGINYLQQNRSVIVGSPSSGYIAPYTSPSTTDVTLANNSKFSIVYSNPIANDYTLILVTSTGTSDDGSSTRQVSQLLKFGSILTNQPNAALITQGSVSLSGSANVTNTFNNQNIQSGGVLTISGSANTITSTGVTSTASSIGADVNQNNATLASMSQQDFFANYFGTTDTNTIRGQMQNIYSNSSSTNYSNILNGKTGTSIWIDQTSGTTATISGNTTIGSTTAPVLIIVNGNFGLSGNVTIYGFIFVFGTGAINTLTGSTQIIGGMVSTYNINMSGSLQITYNNSVLTNLQNLSALSYFAKVAGSWKDF